MLGFGRFFRCFPRQTKNPTDAIPNKSAITAQRTRCGSASRSVRKMATSVPTIIPLSAHNATVAALSRPPLPVPAVNPADNPPAMPKPSEARPIVSRPPKRKRSVLLFNQLHPPVLCFAVLGAIRRNRRQRTCTVCAQAAGFNLERAGEGCHHRGGAVRG